MILATTCGDLILLFSGITINDCLTTIWAITAI